MDSPDFYSSLVLTTLSANVGLFMTAPFLGSSVFVKGRCISPTLSPWATSETCVLHKPRDHRPLSTCEHHYVLKFVSDLVPAAQVKQEGQRVDVGRPAQKHGQLQDAGESQGQNIQRQSSAGCTHIMENKPALIAAKEILSHAWLVFHLLRLFCGTLKMNMFSSLKSGPRYWSAWAFLKYI